MPYRRRSRTLTAIVKPTHFCNMKCRYCYLEAEAEQGMMSRRLLQRIVNQLAEVCRDHRCHMIWHGGEPLLAGTDFYEYAKALQKRAEKRHGCTFTNSIQTNGTLVTDTVLSFCKDNGFHLGFSLDGPDVVNFRTRKFSNGLNPFNRIITALKKAKAVGVGGGVVMVLTKQNINEVPTIYQFLKETKIEAKLNPLIYTGRCRTNVEQLGITAPEYGKAMIEFFDLYFNDDQFEPRLDILDVIMGNLIEGRARGCCTFDTNCQDTFVSIGPKGDVYPCGRFDGIRDYWLGSLRTADLHSILHGRTRKQLIAARRKLNKTCCACEYYNICHGGCLSNSVMCGGGLWSRDYYCSAYKMLFRHVEHALGKEVSKLPKGKGQLHEEITCAGSAGD